MAVEVGSLAPDFTLPNQDRELVQLSAALKKRLVVLAFFPAAFSRVCTNEMCTVREGMDELARLSITVMGISADTFFSLKAWANDLNLNFPLLSDFNKEVIPKYGVTNDDLYGMKGTAKRAVFLIDQNGIVRYREILEVVSEEPDYEKLKLAIASL